MNKGNIAGIIIVLLVIAFNGAFFIVTEGKQAIVTEFGKPIDRELTKAGLYMKIPFTQKVRFLDKRILNWDGFPSQIPTKDKKYIKVDTTARWMIIDALKFIQTVENEAGAKARLDTILDGHTRNVISSHNLVEAVRNSNDIIALIATRKKERASAKTDGNLVIEEEISGDIAKIFTGREKLSQMIVERADAELESLGIKLIDVQLRQISYEKTVETKVYERMISERKRIAQKIRSIGKGEKAKIEGRLARDLNKIESLAYKKAKIIKGTAQAKATKIYAKSLSRDPKFYEFVRSMEAYKASLGSDSKMLLSTDSEFLKYLK